MNGGSGAPRGRLLAAGAAGSAALGCGIALLATSGWLISRASQHPPILDLAVAVTAVRAFGLGRGVLRYAERLLSHDATFRLLAGLRTRVYAALVRIGPAGVPAYRRGELMTRFVADVDTMQDRYLRVLLPAGIATVTGLGSALVAALLLPAAGLALGTVLLVAGVVVPWLTTVVARRAEQALATDRGRLTSGVVELLTHGRELAVAGAFDARLASTAAIDRRLTRAAGRSAYAAGLGAGLVAVCSGAAVLAALVAGAAAVHDGTLNGVALATVVLLPLAAFESVAALPAAAQALPRVRQARRRVAEIVDAPSVLPVPRAPARCPESPFPLVLTDVDATWPGAERPALRGVRLRLTAGKRVVVLGPSGSGKSTLAAVLVRTLPPTSGTYTVGGADVGTLDPDDVRRMVGWCAQDAHLFDSTIRANLRLAAPEAPETALWDALERARAAGWVRSLPRGLDTLVGERGSRVSGGQRQRLALARVLLAGFPIVVLDEPAANLDQETADALTADLLAATADRATVLITHRPEDAALADETLVLAG
ncbi:thiol reductant ABC exporter subunit CydC [Cryptosporangium sp. NPDC051539]|uniref:thiol reductant ABC exporter subunit CydC n=1 Tax=Cryptosporangium sp. NPDC051539 TaxID=3363962 RepID=UPI003797586C